jgi:hypothetical protein
LVSHPAFSSRLIPAPQSTALGSVGGSLHLAVRPIGKEKKKTALFPSRAPNCRTVRACGRQQSASSVSAVDRAHTLRLGVHGMMAGELAVLLFRLDGFSKADVMARISGK